MDIYANLDAITLDDYTMMFNLAYDFQNSDIYGMLGDFFALYEWESKLLPDKWDTKLFLKQIYETQ